MQEAEVSRDKKSFWQSFVNWLYLPDGKTGLIRRLTALALLPCLVWIWNWSKGGPGPYIVPTWRFNEILVVLPLPPEPIYNGMFILAAICCLCLILGGKSKFLVFYLAILLTYFCSVERISALPHYVVMAYIILVALCFNKAGQLSLTRRIIQLAVATCYGFACIQRLATPGHLTGESFRFTVGSGWAVNELFKDFFLYLNTIDWIWAPFTVLVLLTEVFLTFGFFFRKTRKIAFIVGFLLHLSIAITMTPTLITYSLIMVVGYLAFFEGQSDPGMSGQTAGEKANKAIGFKPNSIELALGLLFIALMFIIPARSFFWFDKDSRTITMSDRDPWSFHMFLYKMDTTDVSVRFKRGDGDWIDFPVSKRMKFAASDNDIYGLARYLFLEEPEASLIEIKLKIKQNNFQIDKTARAKRSRKGKFSIEITSTHTRSQELKKY